MEKREWIGYTVKQYQRNWYMHKVDSKYRIDTIRLSDPFPTRKELIDTIKENGLNFIQL